MLESTFRLLKATALLTLLLAPIYSSAVMTIERDDKEINLHILDGLNRLYLEVEIPFHEMGDVSKRLAAVRTIHFLKQNLAEMWEGGQLPETLADLMESSMALGELQYDKIYKRISEASGAQLREVIDETSPRLVKETEEKMNGMDWWRPSGILVEVGAKGRLKLSFLKGLSGTFAGVAIPKCVHRIRKMPLQEMEKDGKMTKMLENYKPGVIDRIYNVILTEFYGHSCTKNFEVLIEKIKEKEGNEFYKNYYFVEEAFVKSQNKILFWADSRVGPSKTASDKKRLGFHGKFGLGIIYGKLTRVEDFLGMTLSSSKTFQLKTSVRNRIRTQARKIFPNLTLLANINWGIQSKVGALIWKNRFFPYFMMGVEAGANINSKTEVNPGTVIDMFGLLDVFADNMSKSFLEGGYSEGSSDVREDVFSLNEYAQGYAKELRAIEEGLVSENEKAAASQ